MSSLRHLLCFVVKDFPVGIGRPLEEAGCGSSNYGKIVPEMEEGTGQQAGSESDQPSIASRNDRLTARFLEMNDWCVGGGEMTTHRSSSKNHQVWKKIMLWSSGHALSRCFMHTIKAVDLLTVFSVPSALIECCARRGTCSPCRCLRCLSAVFVNFGRVFCCLSVGVLS